MYLGAEPVSAIVNQIPTNLMNGLNAVARSCLPSVWRCSSRCFGAAQLAVYFFLGFILNIYLGLPMIAIAGIGVIFAAIQAFRDKELFDMEHKGIATAASGDAATSEEEDFFA